MTKSRNVADSTTATLSNRAIASPVLSGTTTTASGNLAVQPATYILEVKGGGSTEGAIQLNCAVNSHGQVIKSQPHATSATNTLLLPGGSTIGNSDAVLVSNTGTQTLTNKTLTSPALTTPTISTATTNGDLLYGTGSGALTRLGIGSSAQVLTVAAGVPSWATASSGGMTLLASGTLSGAAVTLSSISGSYIDLVLYMRGFYKTVGAGDVRFLISPTTTIAGTYQSSRYGTSLNTTITSGGGVLLGYNVGTTNTNNSAVLTFFDYASATSKKFTAQVYNYYNGTTDEATFIQGINTNAAAMTSLTVEPTGNAWGGGTYALYGVK